MPLNPIISTSHYTLHLGDCLNILPQLEEGSIDAVVCDPPYALTEPRSGGDGKGKAFAARTEEMKERRKGGFMGKSWDAELPGLEHWQAILRVLKSGGYLLAFGGSRTYHRLACLIEDAGFQVRDCLMWIYGSGFPKGKGCLKPAYEPILLARKPGPRVLPLGIDKCRVSTNEVGKPRNYVPREDRENWRITGGTNGDGATSPLGRWPANIIHDGSEEVLEAFAAFGGKGGHAGTYRREQPAGRQGQVYGDVPHHEQGYELKTFCDTGTAARFFANLPFSEEELRFMYCPKASRREREAGLASGNEKTAQQPTGGGTGVSVLRNTHPT